MVVLPSGGLLSGGLPSGGLPSGGLLSGGLPSDGLLSTVRSGYTYVRENVYIELHMPFK